MSFDWKFEEEPSLGETVRSGGTPPHPRQFLRRWGLRLLALLLVIALVAVLWHRYQQRLVREAETQLRAVVNLELQAISNRDAEILRRLQDPADRIWRERQVARYALPDQPPFVPAPGLEPSERPPEIRRIALTGSLAEVQLVRWFQEPLAAAPEPLSFLLTWHYRQDGRGDWFHMAPPDENLDPGRTLSTTVRISAAQKLVVGFTALGHAGAVGGAGVGEDPYLVDTAIYSPKLTVHATRQEAQLLQPGMERLGELLRRACQTLHCPNGAQYQLDFADIPQPQIAAQRWSLPALYLAGIPNTQASIAVWERALQRWLVEALARTHAEGLERRILYWQLVERLQAQLGLRPQVAPDGQQLARAVTANQQHDLSEVWEADYSSVTADVTPVLEAEAVALLDLLIEQAGEDGLTQLAPALRHRTYPSTWALFSTFGLDPEAFATSWYDYLSELTGAPVTPFSTFPLAPATRESLVPPPDPLVSELPPGDQVALICDGRVWVGDADGSGMQPLTAEGERFAFPTWSPDGRWLALRWLHTAGDERGALYLLAADGSSGRLLTEDPFSDFWVYHWTADGRYLIYRSETSILGIRIDNGVARRLPGLPFWSPEGAHLAYAYADSRGVGLARADWGDAHKILTGTAFFNANPWSPDGRRLALELRGDSADDNMIGIYNLASGRLDRLLSPVELAQALRSFQGEPLTNRPEPVDVTGTAPGYIAPRGWSADGSRLLAQALGGDLDTEEGFARLLFVVPTDGSPAQVVAYVQGLYFTALQWSPKDPGQFLLRWTGQGQNPAGPNGFLLDVDAGVLYSATQVSDVSWSPDGAWAAFSGPNAIEIVTKHGQRRYVLAAEALGGAQRCHSLTWNPVADLSRLGKD